MNGALVEEVEAERLRRIDAPFPEGESYRQVVARVRAFLDDLPEDASNGSILIIGHRATKYALDCLLAGEDLVRALGQSFRWRKGWVYESPGSPSLGEDVTDL
jgi:broad specificity phosphatase PhoE